MSNSKSKVTMGGLAIAAIVVVVAIKGLAVALKPSVNLSDLRAYSDPPGAFSAKFPGKPKIVEQPTSLPGVKFKMHAVEIGDTFFAMGYYDLPDDLTLDGREQEAMGLELKGFAKAVKATPQGAARQFEIQGEQAQEVRLKGKDGAELLMRMVIREDTRIYRIIYMSKSYDEALAKAFVESFEMDGEL